jgi:hypothetical protein
MPDAFIVKTEDFMNADLNVRLVTYERQDEVVYYRFYEIVKNHEAIYTSPSFHGARMLDTIRSCDDALHVVRALLKETGFLTGKVVGA